MPQLLIVLAIVVMVFGTKRLSTLGADLGSAIRGFRKSMQADDAASDKHLADQGGKDSEAINAESKRTEERR